MSRVGRNGTEAGKRKFFVRAGVVGAAVIWALVLAAPAHAAVTAQIQGTTLVVTGDSANEQIALRLQGGAPGTLQVDVGDNGSADFSFDRSLFDHITINAGGGADTLRIDQINGGFTDTEITTLNGGNGADTLIGGFGNETFIGGGGPDLIDGNTGNDTALMGPGADTFNWDPGDANDIVEGQDGVDTMRFNGAAIAETVDVAANGGRLRFTRNIGSVVMDTDNLEKVQFNASGGADIVTVHDLTGTDVTGVTVDLGMPIGTPGGDSAADNVIVEGTAGPDTAGVATVPGGVTVTGLAATTTVLNGELANDTVTVSTLAGDDQVSSAPLGALPLKVTVDGGTENDTYRADDTNDGHTFTVSANGSFAFVSGDGATGLNVLAEDIVLNMLGGNDTTFAVGNLVALTHLTIDGGKGADFLNGGNGPDTFIGGSGNDVIDGNQQDDAAFMGTGSDTFSWDPGDNNDVVEGQDGTDTLKFNGSAITETFDASANGGRLRFTRNIGTVTMDTNDVEKLLVNALGGTDNVLVHDLTGTDVTSLTADLATPAASGTGDGVTDQVVVDGTAGPDGASLVVDGPGALSVHGLFTTVSVQGAELANDTVVVNTLAGNDQVASAPLGPLPVKVTFDGGTETDSFRADDTNDPHTFSVVANGAFAFVSGDGATGVNVAAENVVLNMFGGNDTTFAVGNLVALTDLTIDGGKGADTLNGGNGADTILGGDGNDVIDGNQQDDTAFMGNGNDTFSWDPGDNNDVVEGQDGTDTLRFNGSAIGETFEASANGGRLRFTRNIATVTMDTNDVEKVLVNALGGADVLNVRDLTGTDVTLVTVDLAGTLGGNTGDGAEDSVLHEGTGGIDSFVVSGDAANGVSSTGVAAAVKVLHPEFANDKLQVDTLAGSDTVDSGGLAPNTIQLFVI
jgi:Ca2+-binding RTX toxin-like protein